MSNDKTSDVLPDREPFADENEKRVTPGAFVAAVTGEETDADKDEGHDVKQAAIAEATAGKLGLTAEDLGASPIQPAAARQPLQSAQTVAEPGQLKTVRSEEGDTKSVANASDLSIPQKVNPLGMGMILLFYMAIGVSLAALNLKARAFIMLRWKWLLLAAVLTVVVCAILATRNWFIRTTAQRRIGMIIFVVIPAVVISVVVVALLPVAYRAAALRMIFLLCVCLLPAVMYYLFIATKKYSILNEFIINLDRLGLLEASGPTPTGGKIYNAAETEEERKNRVLTYLQKFEAVYGAFPTDLGGLVLQPTDLSRVLYDRRLTKSDGSTFASIFTAETTVPVILATVLIALGWLITLPPWQGALPQQEAALPALNWLGTFIPEQTPVHFAFIGAYFFSLQMLFRRYVRRDLRASAYVAVSLRIILAVIGIWVAVAAASATFQRFGTQPISQEATNQLLVLGFVIGVFPRVAWQVIGAAVKSIGGGLLRVPSLQTELPISDLDGLTVWHESRLEEEDIENVPNMATADLVDMLLNTRFPPDRIIDWVDQAILYTHLGRLKDNGETDQRREALRVQGIRTASSLIEAYTRSAERHDLDEFEQILKAPDSHRSPIRTLVDTMQTNPNLHLVQRWRGLFPYAPEKLSPSQPSSRLVEVGAHH